MEDQKKCTKPTMFWIHHFKKNPEYGHLRFKKLDKESCKRFLGYPPFDFDETLIDVVDLGTFIKNEETRIPLFIGTALCGTYPYFYGFTDFTKEDKIIGVLSKSVLTGIHYGLGIYKLLAGSSFGNFDKIVFFNNE
jgi:hypothetical protein